MPFNGLDGPEGTTERIVCDPDLDDPDPGNGNGPGNGVAAMFSGEAPYKPSTTTGMPKVEIGLDDYAMEWFIKGRSSSSVAGGDVGLVHSGLVTPGGGDTEGDILIGMKVGDSTDILTNIRVSSGFPVLALSSPWTSANWTHVCVSADRAGLVTLYLDGASVDTDDISSFSGTDFVATPVHPMQAGGLANFFYDRIDDNDSLTDNSLVVLSSFAIHARQLTPGEIQVNSDAKKVGLYAETFVRYLFSTFVDAAGASITPTKETTGSSISLFPKFGLPSPQDTELYVPIGTPDDVFIEDTTVNGLHWPLRVQTSYDSAAIANRGACGFATTGAS